ncbi:MAG: nuclear transport factor 2 family protein [Chitinophagaceae bacterium]|nr:nuclear transport factor 2 family protein [Chitinophagaceae bacterium]
MTQHASSDNNAKTTVLAFIEALNKEDFDKAREYVNEDLSFIGVLGTRHGAEPYFGDMKKMKFKYDIKKAFAEGDDVCLLYDINMGKTTIFACGWYQLAGGKISTFKVVFDPRPILEVK